MSDLIERLRQEAYAREQSRTAKLLEEAAAELTESEAEIESLTASLKERDAAIEAAYKEGFNTGWLHCWREEFEETSDDSWRMSDARKALTTATLDGEGEKTL